MVEQHVEGVCVAGSSPALGTNGSVTLIGKGAVLKTASRREIAV